MRKTLSFILCIVLLILFLCSCGETESNITSPSYLSNGSFERLFIFTLNDDEKSYLIEAADTTLDAIVEIPNKYNGRPVTRIGDYAFRYCKNYIKVIIPSNISYIGKFAFYGCERLASVTLENGVTYIGNSAFSNCYNLKRINIPNSVTYIGESVFWNCNSIMDISIPTSVTYIGRNAFDGIPLNVITYKGTVEQWHKIDANNIAGFTPITIRCTDGDIISN